MLQHHHHQPPQEAPAPTTSSNSNAEAPPKQVAMAMERLGQAARLIADIRLGADRLLEALFVAAQPHQSSKPVHLFVKEDSSIQQHILDLRSIGRQLQESGVLNESLRSRSNSWGLHMPLVCPDGAVVAYAWKRQLAGQAGASAVDRTRLALKAFTDQKRQFFPHLDDEETEPVAKRSRVQIPVNNKDADLSDCKTVSVILSHVEKEVTNLKTFTYERLDWLERATSLPSTSNDSSMGTPKHKFPTSSILRPGSQVAVAADKVAVVELFFPSIFRAIISLHPAGCTDPDAVAFYSPDEGGSYMHARGSSVYHVFQHISEHAAIALQYFRRVRAETALYTLLHWICRYQTLFSKACRKCGRLLARERQSGLLLPPTCRTFRNFLASITSSVQQIPETTEAYHSGCFPGNAKHH